ncbi:ABC transporter substrate-binding protein [Desulfofalx alkaliphila]|uniref:ABC transporter substrate-binding protein n=1 Tax=Desulfofalx alkaliphila TaxID=105483 RepID=UPI0004E1569E|nr:ABC transporter substrate-binding protein [Desulfofalx alkaliphila]
MSAKRLFKIFTCLLLLTLLFGCGGGRPDTYTVADETGDWGYPSPHGIYARGPAYVRMSLLFDTLIWKDAQGFVPALAEKWEYMAEEQAYLFTLRPGVSWHDGKPFTAKDVAFTFNYFKEHPFVFADISDVAGVQVINEYDVKIVLEKPRASFLEDVAGTLPIIPEHLWQDVADPWNYQQPQALVGTGPFKLADYSREHGSYLYTANENYYLGRPLIENLQFVKMSKDVVPAALRRGEINAAEIPPEMTGPLSDEGFNVISGPLYWNHRLMINHTKEPFNENRLRRALAHAIDREELVQVVARGHGQAGLAGMLPPDNPWHNPQVTQYHHDRVKAKQLLAELGFGPHRPLTLELLVSQRFARDGEIIASQLAQVGIKAELKSLEQKSVDNKINNWDFDLAVTGHGGLGGDPDVLRTLILDDGFNSARYDGNAELVQLLQQQLGEMDAEKRRELINRAQSIYAEEVPALSLYYPRWYFAHDGSLPLYYTKGGIAVGVPLPLNKMAFIESKL